MEDFKPRVSDFHGKTSLIEEPRTMKRNIISLIRRSGLLASFLWYKVNTQLSNTHNCRTNTVKIQQQKNYMYSNIFSVCSIIGWLPFFLIEIFIKKESADNIESVRKWYINCLAMSWEASTRLYAASTSRAATIHSFFFNDYSLTLRPIDLWG